MSEKVALPLTERRIQLALFFEGRSSYLAQISNFTPANWWECDMFGVTKAGYGVEHEIKLSVADFKADTAKQHFYFDRARYERERQGLPEGQYPEPHMVKEHKHQLLHACDRRAPSRFYFVVPKGMITAEQVPAFAGLKYAESRPGWKNVLLSTVKDAPRLHKHKVEDSVVQRIQGVFYHRYWYLRSQVPNLAEEAEKGVPDGASK